MPSAEQRACRTKRAWLGPSRRAELLLVCLMMGLVIAWSRASDAQSPPPKSEQEAERKRLLDQLGLKKSVAKDATSVEGNEKQEKAADPAEGSPAPPAESGTPEAKPEAPRVVFSGAVHRALLGACQSCHGAGGVAARSAYVLEGSLDTDYAATRRQVRSAEPEQSALLRLASGAGHAGGAIFARGSAKYALLSSWISGGAQRGAAAPAAATSGAAPVVSEGRPTPAPAASALPPTPAPAAAPPAVVAAPGEVSVTGLAYAPSVHDGLSEACSRCHRAGALAGNTNYVLLGEVAADFVSARRFVNLQQPEQSPLLRKASGVGHAGGAIYPPASTAHRHLLEWIALGALGPTDAALSAATIPPATTALAPSAPVTAPAAAAPALPDAAAHGPASSAHGKGLSLPLNFRLNGRFDLNYERRNFDTQPFSSGDDALQSYHHFLFLSRQAEGDAVGFSAELVNLSFWKVNYRLSLPEVAGELWLDAGKLLVPFGPDPLFHQSYGGLVGFDQRVLPVLWAQEGLSARLLLEHGDASGSADVYVVRGHELDRRDAVLNLQSDLSPLDSAHLALGARLRASYKALSLFYSGYVNRLGFGRVLYLQALDVEVWRLRGVPVLERMAAELGLLRADVSGAGPGQDYYHFASYFRLRFYLSDQTYLQYRQGLRTFNNRRGVIKDDTRLTREDGSTHNFGLVTRHGPLTFGLYYYLNLEKADEVPDDFLRVTGVYEF